MNNFSIVKIIALIAIFISLLLSFFLLTVKTKNKLANRLLATFIILSAIDISGLFIHAFPKLFLVSKTLTFLLFPTFYFYVLSICYTKFALRKKHLLHAIPFFLYALILMVYFLYERNEFIADYFYRTKWVFSTILLKLQGLLYIIAIIHHLKKHRKIYVENYAAGEISIYKLLYQISLLMAITFPLTIARELMFFADIQAVVQWINVALLAIALFMFCWFVLKALYNPELFRGVSPKLQSSKEILHKQKTGNSAETKKEQNPGIAFRIDQIKKYMEEKEPYQEPRFSLQELASQVEIPARELSILINRYIGEHFFDFVNKYRIQKATDLLKNSGKDELTIQQILFDAGFNSKSSFNTAFKKHTGLTPTEYRNKHT